MHASLTAALVVTLSVGVAWAQPAGLRQDLSPEDLERVRRVTAPTADFSAPENFEAMSAGGGTVKKLVNQDVFSFSLSNLSFEQEERFKLGNALFRKVWVSAPSSTEASDGLGPLFNARGCQNCHLKDGRGHPPHGDGRESAVSMFLRLSVPPDNPAEQALLDSHKLNVIAEPTYGTQLQEFAVQGLKSEGKMRIDYADLPVALGDGEVVTLRSPAYAISDPAYGPVAEDVMISPRVAPQMIGLGLLEQVPAEDILAQADPEDADGDGISGRPNRVLDPETGEVVLGRFGWKAGAPTIKAQSSGAFVGDIGIDAARQPSARRLHASPDRLPRGAHRRTGKAWRFRSARSGAGAGHLLLADTGRAAAAQCRPPGGAARQGSVLRSRLRIVPYAQIRHLAQRP